MLPRHAEDREPETVDEPPVGAVEDPQDEPALRDEALAPIADAEPRDDGADPPQAADEDDTTGAPDAHDGPVAARQDDARTAEEDR